MPQRREEIAQEKAELGGGLEGRRGRIGELERQRRDLEGNVALTESRLKEFQTKLNQIKTNKEYQAALKEIAQTKKENLQIEDKVLQLMTEIETLSKEAKALEDKAQSRTEEHAQEEEELNRDETELAQQLQTLDLERKVKMTGLDPSILVQYDRVRRVRAEAVARVASGICQGCHMQVPPQLTILIRRAESVYTCPSCTRILYLEEEGK